MTLRAILAVLQVCAALAYAGLAVRLYRSGRVASLPCFTLYAGLMVVDLIWHPVRLPQAVLIEPWLMGLRFCSVIEAAGLISEDLAHRKPLIVSVLFLGCSISSQTLGYFDLGTWRGIYTTSTSLGSSGIVDYLPFAGMISQGRILLVWAVLSC